MYRHGLSRIFCCHWEQGGRGLSVTASMSTASGSVPEAAANNPGYCDSPDAATKGYHVQQTVSTACHFKAQCWIMLCCKEW